MKNKVGVGLLIIGVVVTININLVFSMGSRVEKDKAESVVQKEENPGLKEEKAVGEKNQENTITKAGEEGKVQYEEYVPEVLIEGKWGKGPGEFDKICHWSLSGDEKTYQPESIVVDSKGNIYILDVVNNRIQKFNKEGKYIKSIKVDSYDGELIGYVLEYKTKEGIEEFLVDTKEREDAIHKNLPIIQEIRKPDKVLGINIVIDSKDNLYYYCIRGEKGEVWLFKDDRLVRKWEVPYRNYMDKGIIIDTLDDSIWSRSIIQNKKIQIRKKYNVKEGKVYTKEERNKQKEKIKKEYLKKGVKKGSIIRTGRSYSEPINLKITEEGIQVYKIKVIKKGNK